MDLAQLANVGEFIGGVTVLVTLIYLAVQVRQTTSQVRTQTASTVVSNMQGAFDPMFQHWGVYARGMQQTESLSNDDKLLFFSLLMRIFHAAQNSFYQRRAGALDSEWDDLQGKVTVFMISFPGCKAWWEEFQAFFGNDFRVHINRLVETAERT